MASPSFTVVDDGSSRPDLAMRRELKFVFTHRDVATLRRILLGSCRRIVYAGPTSTVRSVYFDDPSLGACRANLDGVGIRHKTRIRWYDSEQPTERFFVEIKWRRHQLCGKHRLQVSSQAPPGDSAYRHLLAELRRTLPAPYDRPLAQDTEPVVLVEYRREHFGLRGGAARLTLDYDIRYYPQLGRNRISRRFAEPLPGIALIECKSAIDDPVSPREILAPLRARATRFSKYAVGCQRLGYVSTV